MIRHAIIKCDKSMRKVKNFITSITYISIFIFIC